MKDLRHPSLGDPLTDLIFTALGIARDARDVLEYTLPPLLPPARRDFPRALANRMESRALFAEEMLRDLESLLLQLDRIIADGTLTEHICDPYSMSDDVIEQTRRTDDAQAIMEAAKPLRALRVSLSAVTDARRAEELGVSLRTG